MIAASRSGPASVALALFALAAPLGCGSPKSGPDAGLVEATGPLPAPAGHVADLFIPAPGATWGKARAAIGGAGLFLPQAFGPLVATLVGIPATLSAEIDDAVPVVGAATRAGRGPLQVVAGVHVKAGDRFVDQLTRGEGARFNAALDPASHVTLLTDKTAPGSARVALGVMGNYLLVGATPADLYAVGPYVVRTVAVTMGGGPPPPAMAPAQKDDVVIELPEKALAGPWLDEARALQGRATGGGVALVPFTGLLDAATTLLGDAKGARCALNFDAVTRGGDPPDPPPQAMTTGMAHARCTLAPKPGGAGEKLAKDLLVGDVKPILELPDNTSVALLWRESAAQRAENAGKQADALAGLFAVSSPDDKAAIGAALRAEATARGDWQTVGVAFNGTGPTAVVRAAASDAEGMKKALKQLVDLGDLASFKKTLGTFGIKLASEKAVVETLAADVVRIRLARGDDAKDAKKKPADAKADPKTDPKADPKARADAPKEVDLLYYVEAGGLFAAAGYDPKDALKALAKAASGNNLGGVAQVRSILEPLGGEALFVLEADIPRVQAMTSGGTPPASPQPLVLAVGRTSSSTELWGRADVPIPVLQQIATDTLRRSKGAP